MIEQRPRPETRDEIERDCVSGLVEVLRTEGIEGVRHAPWDATGWPEITRPVRLAHRRLDEKQRVGRRCGRGGRRRSSP